MKHFIVEIIYIAPVERINEIRERHRAFLQTGYDKGIILMSGPKEPRTGGILIARGNSKDEVEEYLKNDPYRIEKTAEYKYIEFSPVHYQELIKEWI